MKNEQIHAEEKKLLYRLNRIQGQIEGLKRSLSERKDCLATMGQVKAIHNAVKGFGEAYVSSFVDQCVKEEHATAAFKKQVDALVRSAFKL